MKKYKMAAIAIQYILLAIVLYFLLFGIKDLKTPKFDLPYACLSALFVIFQRFFSILRLRLMLGSGISYPFVRLASAQLTGCAFGLLTPGKMGEAYKIIALGHDTASRRNLTGIFFSEKILDVSFYVIFGLLASLITGHYLKETIALFLIVSTAVLVYIRLHKRLSIDATTSMSMSTGMLSGLSFAALVISFHFGIISTGVAIPALQSLHIVSHSGVIAAISMLPGGLGGREVTSAFLLSRTIPLDLSEARNIAVFHTMILYGTTFLCAIIAFAADKLLRPTKSSHEKQSNP